MSKKNSTSEIYWGIVMVVFGGLFLLRNFDIIDFSFAIRTYWPVILIVVGLSIVVKSMSRRQPKNNENS
jgi:lia operon protein LiaF